MSKPVRCPVHDHPDSQPNESWGCPEDCPDWLTEVDRVVEDVQIHGNFIRTIMTDGVVYRQTFRNHQPVGEPVAWRPTHDV